MNTIKLSYSESELKNIVENSYSFNILNKQLYVPLSYAKHLIFNVGLTDYLPNLVKNNDLIGTTTPCIPLNKRDDMMELILHFATSFSIIIPNNNHDDKNEYKISGSIINYPAYNMLDYLNIQKFISSNSISHKYFYDHITKNITVEENINDILVTDLNSRAIISQNAFDVKSADFNDHPNSDITFFFQCPSELYKKILHNINSGNSIYFYYCIISHDGVAHATTFIIDSDTNQIHYYDPLFNTNSRDNITKETIISEYIKSFNKQNKTMYTYESQYSICKGIPCLITRNDLMCVMESFLFILMYYNRRKYEKHNTNKIIKNTTYIECVKKLISMKNNLVDIDDNTNIIKPKPFNDLRCKEMEFKNHSMLCEYDIFINLLYTIRYNLNQTIQSKNVYLDLFNDTNTNELNVSKFVNYKNKIKYSVYILDTNIIKKYILFTMIIILIFIYMYYIKYYVNNTQTPHDQQILQNTQMLQNAQNTQILQPIIQNNTYLKPFINPL